MILVLTVHVVLRGNCEVADWKKQKIEKNYKNIVLIILFM